MQAGQKRWVGQKWSEKEHAGQTNQLDACTTRKQLELDLMSASPYFQRSTRHEDDSKMAIVRVQVSVDPEKEHVKNASTRHSLKKHILDDICKTYEILSDHIHITDNEIYEAALSTMYNMEHAKSILNANNGWGVNDFFQYFKDHHIQFPFARTPYSVHQLPSHRPPPPPLPSSHSSNSTNVGKDDDAMSTGSTTYRGSPTASSPLTRRNSISW